MSAPHPPEEPIPAPERASPTSASPSRPDDAGDQTSTTEAEPNEVRPTEARPTGSAPAAGDTHRCFICLGDEPEAKLPRDWVTPCNCTLQGHSDCLMAWIADLESQQRELKCPLCKSKIVVLDRWDPAVQLSDRLTRQLSGLSPLVLFSFFSGGILISSAVYGMHALEVFAGPEVALRYVLRHPLDATLYTDKWSEWLPATRSVPYRKPDLLNFLSLTLVGPALILNRMHLGEVIMIPSSLMYALFFIDHKADVFAWPPSPQRALAAFPAMKALYAQLYRTASKALDKKLQALASQARTLQGAPVAPAEPGHEVQAGEQNANPIIDIQIDLQLGEEENAADGDQNPPQNDAPQPRQPRPLNVANSIVNYLAGALVWPSVSFSVGSLLALILPKKWVTKPAVGPVTGLLQERWGRSLVGGCLFVVLKDAFFLYVKYRRAVNRPHRRIQNTSRRNRTDQST